MKWKHLPIVAFDTETTGLQPFGGDRIIEFAAVVFTLTPDGAVAGRSDHSWLINPGMSIPRKVTEITGISDADVANAPPFEDVAEEVYALLGSGVTVAHNYPFDLAFLTAAFQKLGWGWPEPIAEIDTVDLSIKHFSNERTHKLSDLCSRMGVSLDNAHRATDDAAACGECFIQLAQRHDVQDALQPMLDWAGAIGRPPDEAPIRWNDGQIVFAAGDLEGQPIKEHPIHLAWMQKARQRRNGEWQYRFSESTRRWVGRWLQVRGAGRARQSPKSFRPEDWVLDPCIADPRSLGS